MRVIQSPFRRAFAAAAVAIVAATAWAPAVAAQESDQDLRRENARLRTENERLREELEQAQERLRALERHVKVLQAQAKGRAAETPVEPERVSIDESKANASPRALLRALQASYEDALGSLPRGEAGSRERVVYERELERWRAHAEREFRTPIAWHLDLREVRTRPGVKGSQLTVVAVDPKYDTVLGPEFVILLSELQTRLLRDRMEATGERERLALDGIVRPRIALNPAREAAGTFDNPPLIGPYAEFGFGVDVRSLQPVEERPTDEATESEGTDEAEGNDSPPDGGDE